jgi:flagellar motor switch/type III secretory pathway protein FliN
MKDFMAATGRLAVDIGSGWISRYEVGILGIGDIVRADEEAGRAQRVTLNGAYFCDATLAVVGDAFFARIERFEPVAPPPALPERGSEGTELLPFEIRLASIDVTLGALSGIGRFSFIDLGRSLGEGEAADAEFLVADTVVAAGKVVVMDERFGIRLTRRLVERFEEKEMRTSGALLFSGYSVEPIKDYNFRMPDCFTKRGILKALDLHVGFLRTLASRLPLAARYQITCVDQLAYREWAEKEPASGRLYALLGTIPARERNEERRTLPAKLILRPDEAREPLDVHLFNALSSYAERSREHTGTRPIIASLGGSMRSLLEEDPGLELTGACLRNGWRRIADIHVERAAVSERVPGDDAAYPDEMILLVSIRALDETEDGSLDLVYPLRSLEALFTALNA